MLTLVACAAEALAPTSALPVGYIPNVSSDWWQYVGPGNIPLLAAIAEGLVLRAGPGMAAPYVFDGELIGTNRVRALARLRLVDAPLLGPPTITPDGARVLAEWDEAEWCRRRGLPYRGVSGH